MLEHFAVNCEPSIWISYELILIIDWGNDLKIEVFEVVSLGCSYCLYFPLVGPHFGDAYKCLHAVAPPVQQEEGVTGRLESGHAGNWGEIVDIIGIIAESILSRPDAKAAKLLSAISGEVVILPISTSGCHFLVSNRILSVIVLYLKVSITVRVWITLFERLQFINLQLACFHFPQPDCSVGG